MALALEYPWEKWIVYLHPTQKELVQKEYNGPFRVSGSAGTGKTIVALHRAAYLTKKDEGARVLLTTFSETLAYSLRKKVKQLIYSTPKLGERLDVESIESVGLRLYKIHFGKVNLVSEDEVKLLLEASLVKRKDVKFTLRFLYSEWIEIVDAWQLEDENAYLEFKRLGKKTRLAEVKRKQLWKIFSDTKEQLQKQNKITHSNLFYKLSKKMRELNNLPYNYIIIDEAQDIQPMELQFLGSFQRKNKDALFFAGDLGQRIFGQPFSWKLAGVDIVGRSKTLHINYRTSHQIRNQADRLLGKEITDVDGNVEKRKGTVSLFDGPKPEIKIFKNNQEENKYVAEWMTKKISDGLKLEEIGIFVRTEKEIERVKGVFEKNNLNYKILSEKVETTIGYVSLSTMHLAKGLEFKTVVIMACEDEVIPSSERIENASDEVELEEIYNTERYLLYVAITRARDSLLITATGPESEFLDDLKYNETSKEV